MRRFLATHSIVLLAAGSLIGCKKGERFAEANATAGADMEVVRVVGYHEGAGVAFVAKRGNAEYFVTGDHLAGPYKDVKFEATSRDDRTLAYTAQKEDGKNVLVVNGEETARNVQGPPLISDDGRTVAYLSGASAALMLSPGGQHQWCLEGGGQVVAGDREFPVAEACYLRMDPAGHVAYMARREARGQWAAFKDGVALGRKFDQAGEITFCGDKLLFSGTRDSGAYVVFDEAEYGPYERTAALTCAEDGPVFAFMAKTKSGELLLVQRGMETPFDDVSAPVISKDGKRILYVGTKDGVTRAYVDGRPTSAYDDIDRAALSADGASVMLVAKRGEKHLLVVDGQEKEVAGFDRLIAPFFSIDKQVVAAVGKRNEKFFVLTNGKPGAEMTKVLDLIPTLRGTVALGQRADKTLVECDGRELGVFDQVSDLKVSRDGRQVAFVGRNGRVIRRVVHVL